MGTGNIEIGRYDLWVLITEERKRECRERKAKEKFMRNIFLSGNNLTCLFSRYTNEVGEYEKKKKKMEKVGTYAHDSNI